MKRLLVTGVSGLLGLTLVLQAADRYEVWGSLRRERVAVGKLPGFHPVYTDLLQEGAVERLLDASTPDVVIHCAALTEIDECESQPERAMRMNALLPEKLAQETARRGVELVHISTDAVFDGSRGDYTEEDTPNPINVYARTKLEGERRVAQADPNALIARVNFFGWSWSGKRSLAEWFYNHLKAGEAVKGFQDVLFSPLLVTDLAEVLLELATAEQNGVYHVVSPEPICKYDFGRMLARQFGLDENLITPTSYQPTDLRAVRSRSLNLRSVRLPQVLTHPLPGQQESMRCFYDQFCNARPQMLRGLLKSAEE